MKTPGVLEDVCEFVSGELGIGCGAVSAGMVAGATGQTYLPVGFQQGAIAEAAGSELQEALVAPEFLGPFQAVIQLLHGRFHVAARDREGGGVICRVVHVWRPVSQVRQRAAHDAARTG